MNNNCKYLKQGFNKLKCTKLKKEITWSDCKNCEYKEYKEINKLKATTQLKAKKPIKRVSKKRITVSKETYEIVYNESKGRCALCNNIDNLQLHHINGRGKFLTDDPCNCIMLCMDCHHNKVHKNNKHYRQILLNIKGGGED